MRVPASISIIGTGNMARTIGNQALDTVCTLYLASPDQPAEPLKDLRGAALVSRA